MDVQGEVFDEGFLAVVFALFTHDGAIEVEDQGFDAAGLPRLPQISGHVEKDRLEEENETHPLVVLVVFDFVFAVDVRRHSRLDDVLAYPARQPVGDRERGIDPAVGVHHVQRNFIDDAVDWVSDVLARRHQ